LLGSGGVRILSSVVVRTVFVIVLGVPGVLGVVGVLAVLGVASVAHADDVVAYPADGDADAAAADARVEALDDAFGKAISQALSDVLDPEVRRQNKPVIERELIRRARRWIIGFTVTREAVVDDRKQLSVSVRVDRERMRARLAELNIAVKAPADAPAANAPSATVLLRVTAPEGVRATYGLAADKDVPGFAALSGALRRANMVVKRASAAGPAARPDGELPLDDDTAEALAAEVKADLVAIAGVAVGAPVLLRGIDASGVLITARIRLLDRRSPIAGGGDPRGIDRKARKALGQASVVVAARGTDPVVVGHAIDRALMSALADVLPPPAHKLSPAQSYAGNDAPSGEASCWCGSRAARRGRSCRPRSSTCSAHAACRERRYATSRRRAGSSASRPASRSTGSPRS
jgi:hypothetical protein